MSGLFHFLLCCQYGFYDAFGNLDDAIDPLSLETNYLYTGQQFDGLYTELYNLRARQYDPTQGRFISRDTYAYNYSNPFELNRYVYGANNPVRYTDPNGYAILVQDGIKKSTIDVAAIKSLDILGIKVLAASCVATFAILMVAGSFVDDGLKLLPELPTLADECTPNQMRVQIQRNNCAEDYSLIAFSIKK